MAFFQSIGSMMQGILMDALKNPDFQRAGVDALRNIGRQILDNRNNPAKLAEIGNTLHEHPKNTLGAIVKGTSAEKLVDPGIIPAPPGDRPGSGGAG